MLHYLLFLKRQPSFLFYLLGVYVILQFSWWAYHIIQLTHEIGYDQLEVNKRIGMIIGEGLVFFMILIFGLWKIIMSVRKEHELVRRQRDFLLSVTHELKTPLASTKLYLQTLLKRNFEIEKREELLHKALIENKRLEEIVEAILISARIENRSLEIHKEKININQELRQIISDIEQKSNVLPIRIKAAQKEIKVENDLFMIKTILLNLIENAVKYGGNQEPICVQISEEDNQLIIQVQDFGPGIPKEFQQSIFEKFVRIENEETRSQKGTGLGLFIVKEFANLCGGSLHYRDNNPRGSIFELRLLI